ncbi:MAG TPA: hypothetical protein VGM33_08535 [Baekduia sp.]|jgi:hypothetical protein
MSTPQRNDACVIAVDPSVAGILRLQTLAVLEANHHHFEDLRELRPEEQHALLVLYRDAFAVLDALGWAAVASVAVDVPLTAGHAEQLRRCHADLVETNHDRRAALATAADPEARRAIRADIAADRAAADALVHLLAALSARTR